MSRLGRRIVIFPIVLAFMCLIVSTSNAANIFVKEGKAFYYSDKVFLEKSQLLKKPIIVQYFGENSVSIIFADEAIITENEIIIPKGEQFILDYNGKVSQRLRFENTSIENMLGVEIPGTYIEGNKVMVKFEGIFDTLLIEEGELGRRKISLAQRREFDEISGELHLFDGYSLSLDKNNNLEEQVSFRELAFGGTLKCQIDTATSFTQNVQPSDGPYNPYSTPLPIDSANRTTPKPVLLKYNVPPLKKVGILPFKDQGEIAGYSKYIQEFVAKSLGDDVEIVEIVLEEGATAGIYLFDRAVRLGEEFGVDGIIQGRIRKLSVFGAEHEQHFAKEVRISCEIEASLVDTVRGKYLWKNVAKVKDYSNAADYGSSQKSILREIVKKGIGKLCEDIKRKKSLDGGEQR